MDVRPTVHIYSIVPNFISSYPCSVLVRNQKLPNWVVQHPEDGAVYRVLQE
ncbi:MAG: hypothetical protein JXM79_06440 [Sedimentisphaerales bacterium]|nr:hypothetical protein [Sedimentisphaerales bacterium]